ncbi:MAG: T9SS type A sorting domain-containing protein [Bacteroidia bacterium]|nr:T9SS type A sorting domain-containing protein [Bacteroidia bacterium]
MIKSLFIFLLCCIAQTHFAQSPPYLFQNLFGNPTRFELAQSVNKFNNDYLVISHNDGFNNGNIEIDLRLIDENGIITTLKNISLPNINLVTTPRKPSINWLDTSIFIVGRMAGNVWHGMLWKIDKNLDTLWHKEYTNPIADSALQFASSLVVSDGLIVYGSSGQFDFGDCFIMKVDFNGNELWRKTVQVPGQIGGILKMVHSLDKGFVCYQQIIYPNTDTDYRVVKYDSLFNQIWANTYYTPFKDYEGNFIETSDSNYVICNGYTDVMLAGVMGTPKSRNNLLKINKNNGSVIWNKKYGTAGNFTELLNVQELDNGNLMTIGLHVTAYVGPKPKGAYVTHVMLTNSVGDSLNYQTVFADSSSTVNRLRDFCKTNTGYFFVGDAADVNIGSNAQNWLIKADINICFLADCSSLTGLPSFNNTNTIKIYPNPAQHFISITAPYNQSATIKIIDILGSIVLQQELKNETSTINTTMLPNGTYILQFTQNETIFNQSLIINH